MTKGKGRTPGFGGLDKHIKRDPHRERSQLSSRRKLGELEKHKDYVKRAKRRHERVSKLHALKRAVAQRNPDEFNIKMTQRVIDVATGRMRLKKTRSRTAEKIEELQDSRRSAAYLHHKYDTDTAKLLSALEDVPGLSSAACNQHTVFVDTEDDVRAFDATKHFHTTREMLRKPALRVNLRKASTEPLPSKAAEMKDAEVATHLAAVLRSAEGDIDLKAAAREAREAVRDRRAAEAVKTKHSVALKIREVVERRRRQAELQDLSSSLQRHTKALNNTIKRKQTSKFRQGANARQR